MSAKYKPQARTKIASLRRSGTRTLALPIATHTGQWQLVSIIRAGARDVSETGFAKPFGCMPVA